MDRYHYYDKEVGIKGKGATPQEAMDNAHAKKPLPFKVHKLTINKHGVYHNGHKVKCYSKSLANDRWFLMNPEAKVTTTDSKEYKKKFMDVLYIDEFADLPPTPKITIPFVNLIKNLFTLGKNTGSSQEK